MVFQLCKVNNYITHKNNKIQMLESKNYTSYYRWREVQSIYPPYSSSVNLKAGEQQAKAVPFNQILKRSNT